MPTFNPNGTIEDVISPDGNIPPVVVPEKLVEQPKVEEVEETPEVVEEKVETQEDNLFDAFLDKKSIVQKEEVKEPAKVEKTEAVISNVKQSRDYSDLEPDVVPLFRNMSNDAFNKLKPLYLEHKNLKKTLEEKEGVIKSLNERKPTTSTLEHEEGYLLDNEFRTALAGQNAANYIYNHWAKQHDAIGNGAKEVEILGYDDKTGQYVITQKIPADVNAERFVLKQLAYAQNLQMQQEQNVRQISSTYKNRYSENLNGLKQLEAAYFNVFDKPENVSVYKPVIEKHLQSIPAAFRSHPIASSFAKSLALNEALARMISDIQSKNTSKVEDKSKSSKKPNSGPSAAEAAGDGGKNKGNDEAVTLDDFERIKGGY